MQVLLWRILALLALGVGLAAIVIPVLPTTPFLIVAAWAAGKGWPALERWLLAHARFGVYIRNWRERGAVPRPAKRLAVVMMTASAIALRFTAAPLWACGCAWVLMLGAGTWLWRRPDA